MVISNHISSIFQKIFELIMIIIEKQANNLSSVKKTLNKQKYRLHSVKDRFAYYHHNESQVGKFRKKYLFFIRIFTLRYTTVDSR